MKSVTSKYIYYIALILLFITARLYFIVNSAGYYDIEFKTIAIANSSFPFGIIKNSCTQDIFMPFYYLILRLFTIISKNEIYLRTINSAIALVNIIFLVKIGKKLLNECFGLFLGIVFAISKFFIFYTNLISPYCLNFLVGTVLINFFIDFFKKPDNITSKRLLISNILFIFTDTFGCLFVGIELIFLFLILKRKANIKEYFQKIMYGSAISFFVVLPILITHYFSHINYLIPDSTQAIGFNLNGLYLVLNEYISPYMSFISPENQVKNVPGMLYTYFLNPQIKNINSLKIIITLFYSSILPLVFLFIFSIKTVLKNLKLRFLFLISFCDFIALIILSIYEITDLNPALTLQFYLIMLISFCYGVFLIRDKLIRYILIFCFFAIQIINPSINSFNITIEKKYPVNSAMDIFIKEYDINNSDVIIMPYLGEFGRLYYKNLEFINFSYSKLKKRGKNNILKYLSNKKAKSINKNNIKFLLTDFMLEKQPNDYLTKYFVDNFIDKTQPGSRVILVVDKLNSKPISKNAILKFANNEEYNPRYKKMYFKYAKLPKNDSKLLYDAILSKTFYNFLVLLTESFYVNEIIEYKKIDNEYYNMNTNSDNILNSVMSNESDYVFIVFKRPS